MSDTNDTPTTQPYETTPPSDAVAQGQADAKANAKAEAARSTNRGTTLEDTISDAQETAELNHKVDTEAQPEANQTELKNDTTKKAKQDTAKSQLDPTGEDPISKAEVDRSATDGVNVKGGTSVSNEEAARRAAEHNVPGDAPDGAGPDGEGESVDERNAKDPTVLGGDTPTNPPADEDAKHPAGGKADQSATDSSADKS